VPGSPSSALQIIYFGVVLAFAAKDHFKPVGKPAPPLPCSPEFFTICIISSGVFSFKPIPNAS